MNTLPGIVPITKSKSYLIVNLMVTLCSMKKKHPYISPYLTRQAPTSWYASNGNFLRKGRNEVNIKLCEHSNSNEYLVPPDVVECDKKKMTKPVYDLILGCKRRRELGIVLDFQTKEITIDEIICQ